MTKKENYEKKAELIAQPICDEFSFELVDTEFVKEAGQDYLRIYIDKPGGITVNECEQVSRKMSDILDEEDFIEEAYIFEVSSPGLGRVLKKDKDFQRSIGQKIEIKLFTAVDKKKEFVGTLNSFDAGSIIVVLEDGTEKVFKRSDIAKVNLYVEF